MRKKDKLFLLALLIVNPLNIQNVYAVTVNTQTAQTSDNTETAPQEPVSVPEYEIGKVNEGNGVTSRYTCSYKYTTSVKTSISIDGYNDGTPIMEESLNIKEEDSIISGTPIGLNIKETKNIGYNIVELTVTKSTVKTTSVTKCTCHYKPIKNGDYETWLMNLKKIVAPSNCRDITITGTDCPRTNGLPTCTFDKCGCNTTTSETKTNGIQVDSGEYYNKCKQDAISTAKSKAEERKGASFKLNLPNSNYTKTELESKNENENELTTTYNITGSSSGSGCKLEGKNWKESTTCKYTYSLKKACVNRTTSLVTYKDTCKSDEIESVPTASETWNYFTPLSTKSNENIELSLIPAGDPITVAECLYVMRHNNSTNPGYTNYTSLIKPLNLNQTFKGDALGCTTDKCIENKSDYKLIEGKGCYLTINIKIPVKQKFYHEETTQENKTIFKGFNFYYRQIDYTNPFPNGLDENSYWYDWYTSTNKNPDISASFKTITYQATNINANKIRTYNQNNPYTSWNEMNPNGKSNFISSDDSNLKRVNTTYYSLGCGPANKGKIGCENQ